MFFDLILRNETTYTVIITDSDQTTVTVILTIISTLFVINLLCSQLWPETATEFLHVFSPLPLFCKEIDKHGMPCLVTLTQAVKEFCAFDSI